MVEDRGGLQSGLKRRHVTMISLGGVIGAGLFVGSGAVINQTGPAAVLSYLAAGAVALLLGLLSVAVVAVAFVIKSRRQHARGDTGEGGPPVGNGRFTAGEDRERDPAAATLE